MNLEQSIKLTLKHCEQDYRDEINSVINAFLIEHAPSDPATLLDVFLRFLDAPINAGTPINFNNLSLSNLYSIEIFINSFCSPSTKIQTLTPHLRFFEEDRQKIEAAINETLTGHGLKVTLNV